ncbi:2,3-bisphosphoglycerate-independent phosphoglycerate mutase [Candidatus Nanohalobium constans]|uniref:2,3-bisphosphoglycerate-independent phosphoglycerate mutase n=1 Tax=Candidatus Nanohalobium constans TaxID=2565781 RepID=A0A5Q0UGY0_9ARCH|nr:2,3-bisphosphoglycerate-independent phosphoglycerate mutase [Candidatus Nanohalobium constans]QGA80836.1 2,3-bisphosphoglycerate-independent phosphoglycerate mutase [Candidatus Nanohalobium constans]
MEPVLLVVMDGVGLREETEGNAFKQASTPNLGKLMARNGFAKLDASGPAVGLPEGYTGNSEVGHLHLGAGRKIPQRLTRINQSIENNELKEKEALKNALETAEQENTTVHLAGIISDGGIHGHIDHLKALLEIASNYDVEVKVHCFTDGRDVAPKSAEKFISQIEEWTEEYTGEIATLMGRYYSMDRDHNWERTHKAYQAMAEAEGFHFSDPREAVQKTYDDGDYDYFIQPSVDENYKGMKDDDQLIFYNFRADRERQIVESLLKPGFGQFENPVKPNFVSMFSYRKDFDNPVLFEKQVVENTLGEKIEEAGLSQLRVAESQKKPHVTYFFNGQRELEFEHEDRKFVESDKIKSYDKKPGMHAEEITDTVIEAIENEDYDFILLNYANCDLVGHTGDLEATITAVETVDEQIGRLVDTVEESEFNMLVTADHGNCEDMGSEDSPNTSHSLNLVPLVGVGSVEVEGQSIADVRGLVESFLFD